MPLYRVTFALTIDIDEPDRRAAVDNAEEILTDMKGVLWHDEKVVKSSVMVRKRRMNGELHD